MSAAAGNTLGLEVAQLHGAITYPATGRSANQLVTLDHIGLFTSAIGDVATLPSFPTRDDVNATLESRARAYLHVNCANCHLPGGTGAGQMDFRASNSLADMHACGVTPALGNLGVDGAQVLAPGDPDHSMISIRMKRIGPGRMPFIGSNVVDDTGIAIIDAYIAGITACP